MIKTMWSSKFLSTVIINLLHIVILARAGATASNANSHHLQTPPTQTQPSQAPAIHLPSPTSIDPADHSVSNAISQTTSYLNVNSPLVQHQPLDTISSQPVAADLPPGPQLSVQPTRRPSVPPRVQTHTQTHTTSQPSTTTTSSPSPAPPALTITITAAITQQPPTTPNPIAQTYPQEHLVPSTAAPAFYPTSPIPSSAYMTFDVGQPVPNSRSPASHSPIPDQSRVISTHDEANHKHDGSDIGGLESRAGELRHRPIENDQSSSKHQNNEPFLNNNAQFEPGSSVDLVNNSSQPLYDLNVAASETATETSSILDSMPSTMLPPPKLSPSNQADPPVVSPTTSAPITLTMSTITTSTTSTTTTTTTTTTPAPPSNAPTGGQSSQQTTPRPPPSPPARSPEARARLANETSGRTSSQTAGARQRMIPKTMNKCSQDSDCLNGAVCHGGICFCAPGFTGELCATNIDECLLTKEPCLSGGICVDGINGFECDCQPGYKGDRCQEQVDMCLEAPCLNGAACVNYRTNFTCECEPGWEGRHCESNVDECASSPCQNNATCHDLVNDYRCECGNSGFTGKSCELDIDDCSPNPCGFGARECDDLVADYRCVCHEGFTGKRCDIDVDECQPNPCENNGTCVERSQHPHLFGPLNNNNLNNNNSSLDPFGGGGDQSADSSGRTNNLLAYLAANGNGNASQPANLSQLAGFQCECREEFYGDRCEERKKCYSRPLAELCNNPQAECVNSNSSPGYECLISASFDGSGLNYATYRLGGSGDFRLREIYVRYRSFTGGVLMSFETSSPGGGGGGGAGGPAGGESPVADIQLNKSGLYLSGAPIKRDEHINFYELLDGNEREIKLGLDTPTEIRSITLARQLVPLAHNHHHHHHHHNATPTSSSSNTLISQQPPFKGCLLQVRLNNQLVPLLDYPGAGGAGAARLELADNRLEVGDRCRTCFEGDCKNHGRCVSAAPGAPAADRCQCPTGFGGAHCELDVNECEKYPATCHNGGVCENLHGGFRCQCRDGFKGDKCQEIADYCKAKQPCQNGATCKNTQLLSQPTSTTTTAGGSGTAPYLCECPSSHVGKRCERRRDCHNECHTHHGQCINNVTCACLPGRREERIMCEFVASCDSLDSGPEPLCRNGGTCVTSDHGGGGYSCACQEPYYGPVCQHLADKPAFDLWTIVGYSLGGVAASAFAVMLLFTIRSMRKARATSGTYSPSTQEKFGNAASELLKLPNPERLI